jgi:RNA polymerase sigma-70 factor (ECF subfamily)
MVMRELSLTRRGTGMADVSRPDLVALAQQGDAQAIGALYDQHHLALFRYLWSRVGERQTAEELTGDVFMRMLAALPRYRPTVVPFRAWLFRIAHNLLVDHYRKTGGRVSAPLDAAEGLSGEGDPASLVEQKLTFERVHQALETVDEPQRSAIALRFLSGLSLEETATVLDKSESAVKALQHRGLAALRRVLSQEKVHP